MWGKMRWWQGGAWEGLKWRLIERKLEEIKHVWGRLTTGQWPVLKIKHVWTDQSLKTKHVWWRLTTSRAGQRAKLLSGRRDGDASNSGGYICVKKFILQLWTEVRVLLVADVQHGQHWWDCGWELRMVKSRRQRERLNRDGSPPTLTLILSTSLSVLFCFKMLKTMLSIYEEKNKPRRCPSLKLSPCNSLISR